MSDAIQLLIIGLLLAGTAIFIVGVVIIAVLKVIEFEDIDADKLVGDFDDESRL